jgi:NAD(P)-dependent dehydrogenase (short-subunit alcohol dehydrogenase family)
MFDLTGQVAIVTGSSRGLGQYLGRALARAGADLVVTSRTLSSLDETVKDIEAIGRKALPLELDVRNEKSIQSMVAAAEDHYGKIDILVNNAGGNIRKASVDVTWEDWDAVVDTNLKGEFFVAKEVAKRMIPRGYGRIINIGSATTVFAFGGIVPYSASRGGVRQMTMGLADEWGGKGLTVNCLSPGWFRTQQTEVLYSNEEWLAYITDRIPANRPGDPSDLDSAVVFLAAKESGYVNGHNLVIDGGFTTGSTRATVSKE